MGSKQEEDEYPRGVRANGRMLYECISSHKNNGELTYKCAVPVAETIIFKDGNPTSWIFTDRKSGLVQRRTNTKMSGKEFFRHFHKLLIERKRHVKGKPHNYDPDFGCIVALRSGEGHKISCQILSEKEFRGITDTETYSMSTVCLQQYVPCKGGIGSSLRHEYEFKANKTIKTDVYKCFDSKIVQAVQSRVIAELKENFPEGDYTAPTIEMNELEKAKVTGQNIVQTLNKYVKELVKIVQSSRHCTVFKLVTEWLVDDHGDYWLTHAPELYTEPTKKAGTPALKKITNPKHVTEELAEKQRGKCSGDFCEYEIEENFDDEDGKRRRRKSKDNYDIQPTRNTELEPDLENMYTIPYRSVYLARVEELTMEHWSKDQEARNFLAFLYGDDSPDYGSIAKIALTGEVPRSMPVAKYYSEVTVCENCYKIYTKLDRGRETAVEQRLSTASTHRKKIVKMIQRTLGAKNDDADEQKPFLTMISRAKKAKASMQTTAGEEEDIPAPDDTGFSFASALLSSQKNKENYDADDFGRSKSSVGNTPNRSGRKPRTNSRARRSPTRAGSVSPGPQPTKKRVNMPDLGQIEDFLGNNWIDSDEKLNDFLNSIKISH